MGHLETPGKQVGVKFPPPSGVPGVRPGAMAASAPTYALHQRRVLLLDGTKICSGRLLDWKKSDSILVDQVKMTTGEDVSTEILKVQLPDPAESLTVRGFSTSTWSALCVAILFRGEVTG